MFADLPMTYWMALENKIAPALNLLEITRPGGNALCFPPFV